MELEFKPASNADLPFARALARRGMIPYYTRHGLWWRDEDFDLGWSGRENYLLVQNRQSCGFVSLSTDARALYIRELHVMAEAQGQGIGSAVLDHAIGLAIARNLPLLRLMVFKDNPAQHLYYRNCLRIVGEDACFWRMERRLGS